MNWFISWIPLPLQYHYHRLQVQHSDGRPRRSNGGEESKRIAIKYFVSSSPSFSTCTVRCCLNFPQLTWSTKKKCFHIADDGPNHAYSLARGPRHLSHLWFWVRNKLRSRKIWTKYGRCGSVLTLGFIISTYPGFVNHGHSGTPTLLKVTQCALSRTRGEVTERYLIFTPAIVLLMFLSGPTEHEQGFE